MRKRKKEFKDSERIPAAPQLSTAQVRSFRVAVRNHYDTHRRTFPWRETTDPYAIVVSEFMLQQTQTERVVPKYLAFLERFPTLCDLASAELKDVIPQWQGLGYNRRALHLLNFAKRVTGRLQGVIPSEVNALTELPGIGPYTAAAIAAFAFNKPTLVLETNIRRALLHHFFPNQERVNDLALYPVLERVLERKDPRRWYSALMDYGHYLASQVPNPNRRSAHHVIQSRFEGSVRQVRGRIIKILGANQGTLTEKALGKELKKLNLHSSSESAIDSLIKDGLILRDRRGVIRFS